MSSNFLSMIKPVKPGAVLEDELTATRVNAIQGLLIELWRGRNLVGSQGISVTAQGDMVTIALNVNLTMGMFVDESGNVQLAPKGDWGGPTGPTGGGGGGTVFAVRQVELELCDGSTITVLAKV